MPTWKAQADSANNENNGARGFEKQKLALLCHKFSGEYCRSCAISVAKYACADIPNIETNLGTSQSVQFRGKSGVHVYQAGVRHCLQSSNSYKWFLGAKLVPAVFKEASY